ncbi:uncharacterized protein LOC132550327 [Ylistrum balloti]|uniref:uncharacterized protein LOC132550327 n=1 Tax=Ylistrum balloti TaxID=509963 RepID=UPI0029059DD1|nr:uncharacterized protein LOC132550327 [Ylistrum balloti]
MATGDDDLTWSEEVIALIKAVSSHGVPILVKVEGGSCESQESDTFSNGDIFQLESIEEKVFVGYCYKSTVQKREILNEDDKILINKDTANNIYVRICLTKPEEEGRKISSIHMENKPPLPDNSYLEFTPQNLVIQTSLEGKSQPPPLPRRGGTNTKSNEAERRPMPPPRKSSTQGISDHGVLAPDQPQRPQFQRERMSSTLSSESINDDVYEMPESENIYDEPADLENAVASSPDHSLKYKTMEFFSKQKGRLQKFKLKVATAMKKEKTAANMDKKSEEHDDDDDDDDYEIPVDPSIKKATIKKYNQTDKEGRQYDTLEKHLMMNKSPSNNYTQLSLGNADQKDTSFGSLSVTGLSNRLIACGLSNVAKVCQEEKVDGRLFLTLNDEDLREVFSVNELQIKKIRMAQNHDWTPKT